MKRFFTAVLALLMLSMAGSISAEIKFSGDARLRPRMDIRDNTSFGTDAETNTKTTDGYYLYRARFNIKGDIGDGWFGHVQLGTSGFAYWTGKFGDPSYSSPHKPSSSSVEGANRGSVDFMLIYFGRKTDKFGYWGGLIPVNGLSNPLLDVHFYPSIMIDVPYFLYSNNGAHGFAGYIGFEKTKLNLTLLADNNYGKKVETTVDSTAGTDFSTEAATHDQYTLMVDMPLKLGEATVQPVAMFTVADRGMDAPMTFGANLTSPKFGQFTLYGTAAMSMQRAGGAANEYDALYFRAKAVGKVGKGTFHGWVDIAERKFDESGYKEKFFYFWLDYQIPVYKSDVGSVSIKPTWRYIQKKVDDVLDNKRHKIELTIDFKFK